MIKLITLRSEAYFLLFIVFVMILNRFLMNVWYLLYVRIVIFLNKLNDYLIIETSIGLIASNYY